MRPCLIILLVELIGWAPAPAQELTRAQKETTLSWLYTMQKANGGFVSDADPGRAPSLPATSSALRAIRYFGGQVKSKEDCKKFTESCFDKVDAGFAATPGGKADVHTTAVGLMAVKELDIGDPRYQVKPVIYLCGHAKTFEQIRIAAAAYETIGAKCELADNWLAFIQKMRNPDGTYGKGDNVARETGSAVAALMRLGGKVEDPASVVKVLKAGQRKDGGWGKAGEKSDLETSYRVMRALVMLKQAPDVKTCRGFVASCRHDNGSYGVRPGEAGSVSGTYFAGIILHWLDAAKK